MSSFIIPIFILSTIGYSVYKKQNAYQSFVFGAKTSFDLVLSSFAYIVAIFIAIEVFIVSGMSAYIANFLSPVFKLVGIPTELSELVLIKPFSGCGSLAVLENIYKTYGADSYLARAGSVIAGSSEAVFYVGAVYFSKTRVTKLSYGLPVAIIANLVGAIIGSFLVKIL